MNRWFTAAAYYICASLWHSGQNSVGYRKLSQLARMKFEPGPIASWMTEKGSDERNAAAALLRKRKREIRLQW